MPDSLGCYPTTLLLFWCSLRSSKRRRGVGRGPAGGRIGRRRALLQALAGQHATWPRCTQPAPARRPPSTSCMARLPLPARAAWHQQRVMPRHAQHACPGHQAAPHPDSASWPHAALARTPPAPPAPRRAASPADTRSGRTRAFQPCLPTSTVATPLRPTRLPSTPSDPRTRRRMSPSYYTTPCSEGKTCCRTTWDW